MIAAIFRRVKVYKCSGRRALSPLDRLALTVHTGNGVVPRQDCSVWLTVAYQMTDREPKRAKPKKRYFQRLRRWVGFDHYLTKVKHWWRRKLRQLVEKSLKRGPIGEIIREDMDFIAYNLLYEMKDVIENKRPLLLPRVASIDETMDELIHTERSFARLGDSDFAMIFWGDRGFQPGYQPYDERLAERMQEVLASQEPNLMIGLINMFGMQGPRNSQRARAGELRDYINPFLDAKTTYYDSIVSRNHSSKDHFLKWKQVWEGKKVVTIEGSMCRLGVGNDLLTNVESLRRILAPAECAFSAYDQILEEALKIEKDVLFLIALGPTAKILAYDLCKAGYRAIDIGHLDICYELFLRNEPHMVAIEGKYVNEASYRSPAACTDPAYLSQIITEVKLPQGTIHFATNDFTGKRAMQPKTAEVEL